MSEVGTLHCQVSFEWEFIINGTVSPQLYTLSGRLLSLWYIPTSYHTVYMRTISC